MDMRYNMPMQDGRNPYGSRGGYVVSSRGRGRRGRRGDRGMYPMHDMNYSGGRGGSRMDRGNYNQDMGGDYANRDMRFDYNSGNYSDMASQDMRARQDYGYDGHYYPQSQGSTYYPIEAMGTFNGYYGMPNQDYGRGMGRHYGYDMRGGYDYNYNDYGDYGETLSEEELEDWNKKLLSQLSDQEKQMFKKEAIMQRAKALKKPMEGFGEKELYTASLMWYTDNKELFGQNVDFAVKGGYGFLADKDVAVKGAEKLAVYYDCIVEGEDD